MVAEKLGAKPVIGVDIDAQAIESANFNAEKITARYSTACQMILQRYTRRQKNLT